PIVFGVAEDPVKLGLVASLARPGGNATGINYFAQEVTAKRLGLLHELVPKAVRMAVLVNPANVPATESTLRDLPEAARAIGLQIQVLKASTRSEIEAAFATLMRDRAEALYVAGDTFFTSQRVQFATLAASYRIPASYPTREAVEAGGLMGYATDRVDMCRQVGAVKSSRARSPPTCRACSRPSSSWGSTCRPSCFETHRSAAELWKHPHSLRAAMLLSMRAQCILAKRSHVAEKPTCGCGKRAPAPFHCFRIVIYNGWRNSNVSSRQRAARSRGWRGCGDSAAAGGQS